jgi:hypothetical protein
LPKPFGFEEILAKELQLGAQDVEQGVRIEFKGDKVYVQSQLIVAHGTKILKPIYFLKQITNKHYIKGCRGEWSRYINANKRL